MESLLNNYFTVLENLYRIKLFSQNNIRRVLMLMYFPIIISSLIYTNSGMLTYIAIFCMVIFSPTLLLPAVYNKIFFLYRNLNKNISKVDFIVSEDFSPNSIEYNSISNNSKSKLYILRLSNNNLIHYNPKKYKTIKKIKELNTFFNKDAKKYFDTLKFKFVEDLFFQKRYLDLNDRICLFSELSLIDIKELLIELNKITSIPQLELSKLFYIKKKSGEYLNINMNNINSAYSQLNRLLKS